MALQLGSFLESYGAARSKRKTIEAHAAEQERVRQAEIAKLQEERTYQEGLFTRKKNFEELQEIGREKRGVEITKNTEKRKLTTDIKLKNIEYGLTTHRDAVGILSTQAKAGNLDESMLDKAIKMKLISTVQANLYRATNASVVTKTVNKEDKDGFDKFYMAVTENKIEAYPGGLEYFKKTYGHLPRFKKPGSIDKIGSSIIAAIEKNAIKKNKNVEQSFPKGTQKVTFPNKTVLLPSSMNSPFQAKPADALKQHKNFISDFTGALLKLHTTNVLDLKKTENYNIVHGMLKSELQTRNRLLKTLYGNHGGISSWDEIGEVNTQLLKVLNPSLSSQTEVTSVSGKTLTRTPYQATKEKEAQVISPVVASVVNKSNVAPVVSLTNAQILDDPTKAQTTNTDLFKPSKPDPTKKGEQLYNTAIAGTPSKYSFNYLTSDHAKITSTLEETVSFENIPVDRREEARRKYFLEGGGQAYKKAYLTSEVSKTFQKYALNSTDNRVRENFRANKVFHRNLLELQKIDSNFDAGSALAESFFKTLSTHNFDNSRNANGSQTNQIEPRYVYHTLNENGELKPLTSMKEAHSKKVASANSTLKELDNVLSLVDSNTLSVGLVSEYITGVQAFFNVANAGVEKIKKLLASDAPLKDENEEVLNVFMTNAKIEEKAINERYKSGKLSNQNKIDYLIASEQLSNKIRLAYLLSSQLQGDGTAGGRTISDADFKYALTAVWGTEPGTIRTRLMNVRMSLESKLRQYQLAERYDRSGVGKDVSEFMGGRNGFEETRRMDIQAEERIISAELLSKSENPNRRGNIANGISSFANVLSESPKKDKIMFVLSTGNNPNNNQNTQNNDKLKKLSMLSRDYLEKQPVFIEAARRFKSIYGKDTGKIEEFYTSSLEQEDFKNSIGKIATRLNHSFYNNEEYEKNDSLFKSIEKDNIEIKEDDNVKGVSLFAPYVQLLKDSTKINENHVNTQQARELNRYLFFYAINQLVQNSK